MRPSILLGGFLLWIAAVPAIAIDPAGVWVLRAGDSDLMVFEITRTATGWAGARIEPAHYAIDSGVLDHVEGPAVRHVARDVHNVPGGVELVMGNGVPGAPPDHVVIRPRDTTSAVMRWTAFDAGPVLLARMPAEPVPGPWRTDHGYMPDRPTDPEMTALFDADQAARTAPRIDWTVLHAADRVRRNRTRVLLDAGRLASADDYYHAAFVFQHGEAPDDFLQAHALATIAVALGRPDASWIAAATLDRYLQSIGRPQIYGTQFTRTRTGLTQEPFRRDLLSDAMRRLGGVPTLVEQERQRQDLERHARGKAP